MLKLKHSGSGKIFYATRDSAGFDLTADEEVVVGPGEWKLINTGLRIVEDCGPQPLQMGPQTLRVLPEMQIRPRSGLAAKHGISVLNAPSTIDADYRGDIKVILVNHSTVPFPVKRGDRIAQAVCALVVQLPDIHVETTERGAGGFGSTGST
jgi:dUTP pyrophosphatase